MISRTLRRHTAVLVAAAVIIAAFLAVAVTAPPAEARPPAPPPPTTTMSVSGCDITVTYAWSGFGGRLTASLRLVEVTGTPLDLSFAFHEVGPVSGKSGSVTRVFHLTAGTHTGRTIYARGSLLKSGTEVGGSRDDSTTVFSTCGTPIT